MRFFHETRSMMFAMVLRVTLYCRARSPSVKSFEAYFFRIVNTSAGPKVARGCPGRLPGRPRPLE